MPVNVEPAAAGGKPGLAQPPQAPGVEPAAAAGDGFVQLQPAVAEAEHEIPEVAFNNVALAVFLEPSAEWDEPEPCLEGPSAEEDPDLDQADFSESAISTCRVFLCC